MDCKWQEGLIECVFVRPVRLDEAEELGDGYEAALVSFGEDGMHATFEVQDGFEEGFIEFCLEDKIVKAAGKVRR